MPAPTLVELRSFREQLQDRQALSEVIEGQIEAYSPEGLSDAEMLLEVSRWAANRDDGLEFYLDRPELKAAVEVAVDELQRAGWAGFNSVNKVWYYKGSIAISEKAEAFFRRNGFSPGWRKISDPRRVIPWMHRRLLPTQFEKFCVALLKVHCGVPVDVTEKDPRSGADGGLDGIGEIEIDGRKYPFGVQVKLYAPYRRVGYLDCERLGGKMARHGWKHGFLITSGRFTEEAIKCIKDYDEQGMQIELIDQERLVDIMLLKNGLPHGFGLHMSTWVSDHDGAERTTFYVNEIDILRAANS